MTAYLIRPVCVLCADRPADWEAEPYGCRAAICDKCRDGLLRAYAELGHVEPIVVGAADASMTDAMVRAYLAGQDFKHARTVPEHPHEYLLVTRSTQPWTHLCVIEWIAEHGRPEQWNPASGRGRGTTYRYFDAGDGWEYWATPPASYGAPSWRQTFGAPTIINRRRAG